MEDKNIIRVLNKVDKSILLLLEGSDKFSDEIELSTALDRSSVINSGRKMLSLGLIKIEGIEEAQFILTKNGEVYLKEGLPEYRIFNFIKNNVTVTYSQLYNMGMDKNEITAAIGYLKKSG